MKIQSKLKIVPCKVCEVPTEEHYRCGAIVCAACKRFFLRQRNQRQALSCYTRRNDCLDVKTSVTIAKSGKLRRFMCPKCRYQKCESIGMRCASDGDTKTSPLSSSPQSDSGHFASSQAIFPVGVANVHFQRMEAVSRQVVETMAEYVRDYAMLPQRSRDYCLLDEHGRPRFTREECIRMTMRDYNSLFTVLVNFMKKMPCFWDFDQQHQTILIHSNVAKMIQMGQIMDKDCGSLGMSGSNYAAACHYFPEFKFMADEARQIKSILEKWGPSQLELSVAIAIIFLDADIVKKASGSNERVYETLSLLNHIFDSITTGSRQKRLSLDYLIASLREMFWRRQFTFQDLIARYPVFQIQGRVLADGIAVLNQEMNKIKNNEENDMDN